MLRQSRPGIQASPGRIRSRATTSQRHSHGLVSCGLLVRSATAPTWTRQRNEPTFSRGRVDIPAPPQAPRQRGAFCAVRSWVDCITYSRRAKATIAFFIPRRLAICMAQALSHDHFFERIMLCAAS
jgi:hypothetical protein